MITSDWQANLEANRPVRPARLWYWVAGGLLASAMICIALGVNGLFSLNQQIKDFQRVPAPGQQEVTFAQRGGYVLYIEKPGGCCSFTVGGGGDTAQSGDGPPFPNWSMRVELQPVGGGPPVSISDWRGAPETYSITGHEGQTAMSFTIGKPGRYDLVFEDAIPRSITDVAVGRSIGSSISGAVIAILSGFFFLVTALLIGGITALRRRRARRSPQPAPAGMVPVATPQPTSDYLVPPAAPSSAAIGPAATEPIMVGFAGPSEQSRLTVLVRLILAIPHFFCLYFLSIGAQVVLVIGWFGALLTARLPEPAANYLSGYLRWKIRLYAYLLLLTDRYPPFTLEDDDYPVRVVFRSGRLNRTAVLFRIILAIPAEVVGSILILGLTTIVAVITWLIVLIMGRMPQPLYQAITAAVRYQARVRGYLYLLTSVRPQGLFGDRPGPGFTAAAGADQAAEDSGTAWAGPPGSRPAPAEGTSGWSVPDQRMSHLVLSRPAKRLVGVFISIGAVVLISPYLLIPLAAASAPMSPGTNTQGSATPTPASAAAARSPIPTGTAPATINVAPGSLTGHELKWLAGLESLQRKLSMAGGTGSSTITPTWLRSVARQMHSCTHALAGLGPAPGPLQPVYRLAAQGCAHYEHGANCYSAAAPMLLDNSGGKVNDLLDCGDAGLNKGGKSLFDAVLKGYNLQGAN